MNPRTQREISDMEWQVERAQAQTIVCPELKCHAAVGETCLNLSSGQPLDHLPAHSRRIRDAREGTQQ